MNKLIIMTDGGSRNNPGKSACGFVIYGVKNFINISEGKLNLIDIINSDNKLIHQEGVYLGIQTNNYAEWMGLVKGLEWLDTNYDLSSVELQVLMDSNLVVQQLLKKWKIKDSKLQVLANQAFNYTNNLNLLNAHHIYREYNKQADELVNQVLDNI